MQVALQTDRDRLNQELTEARSDPKIVIAVREQLEERLGVMTTPPRRTLRIARPQGPRSRQPKPMIK